MHGVPNHRIQHRFKAYSARHGPEAHVTGEGFNEPGKNSMPLSAFYLIFICGNIHLPFACTTRSDSLNPDTICT
jgi:hypothetical protein